MENQLNAIAAVLEQLPESVNKILRQADYPYSFLPHSVIDQLCESTGQDIQQVGLSLLPLATAFAEAPVSHFFVGAVAFDSERNAYLGANFEFAGTHIGQTIHAEQSAIAHAWLRGAKDLDLLVINYAPCGHCRQFINEVNLTDDFCILLPEQPPQSLSTYLPTAFGPADLSIDARILGHRIIEGNDLKALAQNACESSHSPYSQSQSGVAVQFSDHEMVAGCYAENAAFNPSLPPLQVALNIRRLQGKDWRAVEVLIMAEKQSTLSQKENTQMLLQVINAQADFRYLPV